MKNHLSIENISNTFSQNSLVHYNGKIEFPQYYYALNKDFPNLITFYEYIQLEKLFETIVETYQVKAEYIWTNRYYSKADDRFLFNSFLIQLQNDLLVCYDYSDNHLSIYHSDHVARSVLDELCQLIKNSMSETLVEGKIFLLYEASGYLYLKDFSVKKSQIDLTTNYNDDFLDVHRLIVNKLNTPNDKGLVLLHGEPGTGKTHYIRFLTSVIDKKMIYIPPEYADKIASPNFLPLMISNPNSILIIEDAENILASRDETRNAAVSSLLNVADGLLSDCLNLQILCTFNIHIHKIDKALLRKGRLIADYEFKALSAEKSQKLSDALGFQSKIDKETTLAEIYNQNGKSFKNEN